MSNYDSAFDEWIENASKEEIQQLLDEIAADDYLSKEETVFNGGE